MGGGERGREDKTGTVSAGLSVSQHRYVKRSEEKSETMVEDFTKTRRRSCFLVCISLLVVFGTVLGFLAGLLVGGILAKHGHFSSVLNQGETVPLSHCCTTQCVPQLTVKYQMVTPSYQRRARSRPVLIVQTPLRREVEVEGVGSAGRRGSCWCPGPATPSVTGCTASPTSPPSGTPNTLSTVAWPGGTTGT